MKTYLRVYLAAFIAALLPLAAAGQNMIEPTINSTLDNIEIIKVDTDQVFDLFVTAGERSGEPVQVRMVLDNPTDRERISLAYNYNATSPDFADTEFDEQGVAVLGDADAFMDLEDIRVYVRIRVAELGTYGYTFELYREDLNVIAAVSEEVTVALNVPASVRSTLHEDPNIVKGAETDFYIILRQGEIEDDTPVRLRLTLEKKEQAERMGLQAQEGSAYVPLAFDADGVALYGPEAGFILTDSRLMLRATFSDAALYPYTLDLVHAETGAILATRNETAAVNNVAGLPDQLGGERIRVYPTLSTGGYIVLDLGATQQAQVLVHDALGRLVLQLDNVAGTNRVSTQSMAKGLYLVKVRKGDAVAGSRFIVR